MCVCAIAYKDLNYSYMLVKRSVPSCCLHCAAGGLWSLSPLGQTFGKGRIDEKGVLGESKGKLTGESMGMNSNPRTDWNLSIPPPILMMCMSHQSCECLPHGAKHTGDPAVGGSEGASGEGEQL